ncbi:MAG TPA: glycosyltransferase 87 family protein [Candidatus Limnocylindrales bacterium]|nr:glycosyltransferase 87 family protein [Candidatus Limnocylindrales bacterium]
MSDATLASAVDHASRGPRASWQVAGRVVLALVFAAVLLAGVSQSWSNGRSANQQDFFQYWAVGRLAGTGITDIYSDSARHTLAEQIQADAAQGGSAAAVEGAARWDVLETYGTPFLYALFGRLSTGDYDLDSTVWQAISLVCLLAAIVAIARAVGLSWLVALGAAAIVVVTSQAFFSDVRTGNLTEIQLGFIAVFVVLRARWRTRAGDIAAGLTLGLAIAFKPSVALIPLFLLVLWLIDRRPQVLLRQLGGMVAGGAVAVLIGVAAWGSLRPWLDWTTSVGELGGQVTYSTRDGNYALSRIAVEGGWPDPSTVLLVGLVLATIAAMAIGARRSRADASPSSASGEAAWTDRSGSDAFQRECLALSAGIAVVLLASPLSWLYYYLLLVPVQLILLGRIGPGTSPGQVARWILIGMSVVLLWYTPLSTIFGLPTDAFPYVVESVLATAILFGMTLFELAAGSRVPVVTAAAVRRVAGQGPEPGLRAAAGIRGGLAGVAGTIRGLTATPPELEETEEIELGRVGKLAVALLVAAPMVVTAIMLLPEVTLPIPNLNDDAFQYLFIQRMDQTLRSGGNPLDFWVPQLELGFPQALYYQSFPHLVVVLLDRLSLGTIDLFTMFNLVRYALFVGLPLTVYWSMRRMGFSVVASAMAAAASPLFSGAFRYGLEYDSYLWRGFGMFTQAWAVHLSFIALACVYRVVNRGTGYILAMVALSVLLMSHLIYAYMMAITLILVVVVGARRSTIIPRLVRLGIVGVVVLAVTAYQWLPFITSRQYLAVTPYLQQYKFDSFGAPTILGWLFTGDLFDHGRLPVLTVLLALGIAVALFRRTRLNVFVLTGFLVWLVLYFGRPTLGPLFELFPLSDGLLIHRFIGEMELFAVPLMGLGGALIWELVGRATADGRLRLRNASPWRPIVAAAVLIAILVPALLERATFYDVNTHDMQVADTAIKGDPDLAVIVATLKSLPDGGRVYAGLREDWGKQLTLGGSLSVRDVLTFNDIDVAGPPYQGLSLNASLIWWFRDQVQSQYDLVDARYVITPADLKVPDFYTLILQSGRYALYQVPTTGIAEYVAISGRQQEASQRDLFDANVAWFRSDQPGADRFIHWDYMTAAGLPDLSAGCPTGKTLSETDDQDSMDLVVECPTAADLMLKVTYHPNWTVSVDGQPTSTFMVSPSYVGIHLPPGQHHVEATYRPTPSKVPLLLAGLALLAVAILVRRHLDWLPTRLGAMRRARPDPPQESAS